jgi:SAM-dependent methyltransferase
MPPIVDTPPPTDGSANRPPTTFEAYWEHGFPHIEGWVSPDHGPMLALIGQIQTDQGITGHVGEIGVYHGKFLIGLSHIAGAGAKVTALDVFEDQAKNIDGAGQGDLAQLKSNIERYGPADRDYAFVKADSIALTESDKVSIMRDRGPFRVFSVDGCHTAEHTYNDLLTGQEFLAPGGVMILDDFMHPHWPGVTEAAHMFYDRTVPRVKPFLYCHHKLYFVGFGWHRTFMERFQAGIGPRNDMKLVQMFGMPVLAIY